MMGVMAGRDRRPDPEVEILFEGDADRIVDVPILGDGWGDDAETVGSGPHVVGRDRLGDVVASVNETVAEMREQQLEAQQSGATTRTTIFPERTAQVVQATKVPLGDVLALLAQGLQGPGLSLTPEVADIEHGIAVVRGRLRMRVVPLPRTVELRVYPTASANLTVLELLPLRRWMPQTRRYLAAGVPAITALTNRLETAAANAKRHSDET